MQSLLKIQTPMRLQRFKHTILLVCLALLSIHSLHLHAEPAKQKKIALGTGFLISADGHIVTAWHVIKNKSHVYVGPIVGNQWKKARIIKLDEKNDLALIKINSTDKQPLEIAEWADVPIGLEVYSIGYPIPRLLGLSKTVTQGLLNGDRTESGDEGYFQFSAETQKGNSGGPIFSPDGLVIGVVQKKLNAFKTPDCPMCLSENVNYAVKSATLLKFMQDTGVSITVKKINLNQYLRPYEIYRQKHPAVFAVLADNPIDKNAQAINSPEITLDATE